MDKIKIGIIGTGFSAGFHLEALRRLPHVEVVAIAGSTLAKAEETAARYAIRKAYGSWKALIHDDEVESIHNCTPNDLHFEINSEAIRLGKHILSEKPLAIDSQQSAKLVALAEASPVVSGICFNYRHFPLIAEAKRRIISGRSGKINLITGGYLQDWLLEDTDYNWRLFPERSGPTRAIADIGSHWCDLVQHLTGDKIAQVFADLNTVHPVRKMQSEEGGDGEYTEFPVRTEDFGSVLVHFASGAHGVFTVSQVSAGHKNKLTFDIAAANESLRWDQEQPNRLWLGRRGQANREIGTDPTELSEEAAAMVHYPGGHEEGWPDGVKNLFIDFYDTVSRRRQGGDEERPRTFASFRDGHYIVLINEAIAQSHSEKVWVNVHDNLG